LLVSGSPEELIAQSGLASFNVNDDDPALAARLRKLPGVQQVVAMGSRYSVSGRDGPRIAKSLGGIPGLRFEQTETDLEQVFIQLMENVRDTPS
jgi:ABC-2 type transport system ATP-binding protein